MKPYLVDLAVRVQLWIRPHLLKKQFDVIREARPSILFLCSDGGRNEEERKLIAESRKIFEDIDWDCTVYKLYMEENQGLYAMGRIISNFIWSKVESVYFMEDDYVPSVDAFRFCAELLEKYKDDERIAGICTTNLLEKWDCGDSDYFFSNTFSIWGCAIWKRTYMLRDYLKYKNNPYVIKCVMDNSLVGENYKKRIKGYMRDEHYGGHVPGAEFYYAQNICMQNQLFIFPKENLLSNMGFGDGAEHATELKKMPRIIRQMFNIPSHSCSFPLKHPEYVIPDIEFNTQCKKLFCIGNPFLAFCRKLEAIFLRIKYGDFKFLFKKLIEKLSGTRKFEK